jgi:hypothetical protein
LSQKGESKNLLDFDMLTLIINAILNEMQLELNSK